MEWPRASKRARGRTPVEHGQVLASASSESSPFLVKIGSAGKVARPQNYCALVLLRLNRAPSLSQEAMVHVCHPS